MPDKRTNNPNHGRAKSLQFKNKHYISYSALARDYNIRPNLLHTRLNAGWSIDEALEIKKRTRHHDEKCQGVVYKITNIKNNKVYIGLTTKSIDVRLRQHIKDALNNVLNNKLGHAIRKYGSEAFTIKSIFRSTSTKLLSLKEKYYIQKYKTISQGYNTNIGGSLGAISGKSVEYNNVVYNSYKDLAKAYNVDYKILCGRIFSKKWSLEEAIVGTRLKHQLYINREPVKYRSFNQLCNTFHQSLAYIQYSAKYNGVTKEEALLKKIYKDKYNRGLPVSILSITKYNSKTTKLKVVYTKNCLPAAEFVNKSINYSDFDYIVTNSDISLDTKTSVFKVDTQKPLDKIEPQLRITKKQFLTLSKNREKLYALLFNAYSSPRSIKTMYYKKWRYYVDNSI